MKRLLGCLLALFLCSCSNPAPKVDETAAKAEPAPAPPSDTALWTATEGIDSPESVYLDTASGFLFSSQITGQANEKDGTGRIVKMTAEGKLVDANWVKGLNAPKGLRSFKGTLWTADIDTIVGIEIATGKITTQLKVKDAQFLNDVAIGPDGTVYVSDMAASRIYALKAGKVSVFADGPELEYPNGLLLEGDHLVVGGWGKPEADFSTKVPGRLFMLDLKTKKKTLITPEPMANLDGLESDGRGGYIASDWNAGKILRISANGKVDVLQTFKQGTADLAFLPEKNLLILPKMMESAIAEYDLTALMK